MVVTGNETVLFHYRVLLADGRVVESSGVNPERVCLGEGAVPAKLEDSFTGRHPGEAYQPTRALNIGCSIGTTFPSESKRER